MKKILFVIVMMFCLIGCAEYDQRVKETYWNDHKVVEIDSCEYILVTISSETKNYSSIIHKGNCRFCAERQKKFYTEIVDSMFMMQD